MAALRSSESVCSLFHWKGRWLYVVYDYVPMYYLYVLRTDNEGTFSVFFLLISVNRGNTEN